MPETTNGWARVSEQIETDVDLTGERRERSLLINEDGGEVMRVLET